MPAKCFQNYIIFNNQRQEIKNMKKMLSVTLCFTFLNAQIITASPWTSINPKRINDAIAVASGMLSVPCFKKCYDLCQERDSLLRSILPNFDALIATFEAECNKHLSHGYPSGAYYRLWNTFLKTNVEPICPELLPRLRAIDIKSAAFCLAGTFLISAALFCILDNYVPKKATATPRN